RLLLPALAELQRQVARPGLGPAERGDGHDHRRADRDQRHRPDGDAAADQGGQQGGVAGRGVAALVLGVAAVVLMIIQLLFLPFWPGSSGYASVFTGTYPVYLTVVLAMMIWLETLLMRSRSLPAISFVEQPPTFKEAFAVQRFQANLSAFTAVWNYMAVVGLVFWVLFYLL